jgi:sugar phosphate isomerase/epimerase
MHERISANSICFPGADFPTQAGYWRELDLRRVSFVGFDVLGDFAQAREALATGGYELETIVHGFHMGPLDAVDDDWRAARANLTRVIQAGAELGARSIYMVTGGRGRLSWEEAAERFCEGIAPCVPIARQAGLELMIENSPPVFAHLHLGLCLADALSLARMAGIGVCIDIFGCWTQAGLRAALEHAMPWCHLVQISDYVYGDVSYGRAVPGDGDIPLETVLEWLLSAGYAGAFDLELIGRRIDAIGHVEAVRRAGEHLSAILDELGA